MAKGFAARYWLRFWPAGLGIAAIYLLLQGVILLATGTGFQKFWVLQPIETFEYWDAIHYANLAVNLACSAFYPLWPVLVQQLAAPTDAAQALRFSIPASELIFLASLPLGLFTFRRIIQSPPLALLAFVLYALGPNAIFQSIGYTESLFGLLSLLFLLCLQLAEQSQSNSAKAFGLYGAIFVLSGLLNLVRPALLQSWFAIAFTLATLFLIQRCCQAQVQRGLSSRAFILAGLIGLGSLAGYSLYGLFCWRTMGDFFGPFEAQIGWGRTLALRPWLLVLPRSLLLDLHGLYTPVLGFAALGWLLYGVYRQRQALSLSLPRSPWFYIFLVHPLLFAGLLAGLSRFGKPWTTRLTVAQPAQALNRVSRFTVLYAIAFSGVHSLINFLANSGYLYSTARHYFGSPYAFVGIGVMLAALSLPQLNRLTWGLAAVGLLWLAEQWLHYGEGRWLG